MVGKRPKKHGSKLSASSEILAETGTASEAPSDSEGEGDLQNIELKNKLDEVLSKLDTILGENLQLRELNAQLCARIDTLENLLNKHASTTIPLPALEVACPDPPPPPVCRTPKKQYHALLLSDSIFRHVGADSPKKKDDIRGRAIVRDLPIVFARNQPPFLLKRVVVPGARCPRLLSEAFALASEYEFEEIIVHCGTNYLNEDSEIEDTFVEIIEFLRALKDKFQCRVTYSPILPRVSPQEQEPDNHYSPLSEFSANTLHAIRIINGEVGIFCEFISVLYI